ncbi:MAG TPA: 4a-hydroxytetrahydrobiopterin dehydratase [Polyangiaceae bacterium]|nr:4a-hydroxytetrahydrobiopterin dehydratase [Polyangiaceae bacterium]
MARPSKLDDAALAAWLGSHEGWERQGDELAKAYRFGEYAAGVAFAVRVAFAAEKADHHPDLLVSYGRVEVRLSTHDAGGLTRLDLELAEACDALSAGGR